MRSPSPRGGPRRRDVLVVVLAVALLLAACTSSTAHGHVTPSTPGPSATSGSTPTLPPGSTGARVLLSKLDGATVPTTFTLVDDTAGVTAAKFYLTTASKVFLSSADAAPIQATVTVSPGPNKIEVRQTVDGETSRVKVTFTAEGGNAGSSAPSSAPPIAIPSISALATPAPTQTVSTPEELAAALAKARPGAVIMLADGQYMNVKGNRWHLAASGTATAPITLEGGRGAILQSDSTSGDYGLWITGSYWDVIGITVRNATKGIVLDGSQHSIIDDVEVYDIGEEGVHFRSCSSDGILQNSSIHDTGLLKPQFGEGVYVGSAQSNWSKYGCSGGQDKSERTVIRSNAFKHIAAEGADLKEGTDSGDLIGNTFSDTGYSGQNSADSAVDIKARGWTVADNTVTDPEGSDKDAFQTHTLYPGYGTDNTFTGNTVQGTWPGFGFGLYPQAENVVRCDNTAPGAARGLVGAQNKAIACVP